MDEREIDELEALFLEERLREAQPRDRLVYVPPCECGHVSDLCSPAVKVEGDLDAVPPVLWVYCPRCGRRILCEIINSGGLA